MARRGLSPRAGQSRDYISQRPLRAARQLRLQGRAPSPAQLSSGGSRARRRAVPSRAEPRVVAMGRLSGLGPVAAAALVLVLLRCGSGASLARRDLSAGRNDRPIIGKGPRGRRAPASPGRAGPGRETLPERRVGWVWVCCCRQRDAVRAVSKNHAYLREGAALSCQSRDAEGGLVR